MGRRALCRAGHALLDLGRQPRSSRRSRPPDLLAVERERERARVQGRQLVACGRRFGRAGLRAPERARPWRGPRVQLALCKRSRGLPQARRASRDLRFARDRSTRHARGVGSGREDSRAVHASRRRGGRRHGARRLHRGRRLVRPRRWSGGLDARQHPDAGEHARGRPGARGASEGGGVRRLGRDAAHQPLSDGGDGARHPARYGREQRNLRVRDERRRLRRERPARAARGAQRRRVRRVSRRDAQGARPPSLHVALRRRLGGPRGEPALHRRRRRQARLGRRRGGRLPTAGPRDPGARIRAGDGPRARSGHGRALRRGSARAHRAPRIRRPAC